jgi:chaperonin cofactor prefoldin
MLNDKHQELQETITSSKKLSKTDQVVIKMGKLIDKEFRTAVLTELNELKENIEKCFNNLIE